MSYSGTLHLTVSLGWSWEVDEAQITAMLVRNPARYFTGGQE
jgi:hypothetical protein